MKNLLISSTKKNAGKTALGLGICLNLEGKKGYFKPLSDKIVVKEDRIYDEDSKLFRTVLELREKEEEISIFHDYAGILREISRDPDKKESIKKELKRRFEEIRRDRKFVIVESAQNASYGLYAGLSAGDIAKELNLRSIIVAEGDIENIIDKTVMCRYFLNSFGVNLDGVVINKVKNRKEIEDIVVPELKNRGIDVLGILPYEKILSGIIVEDVVDILGANLLTGEKGLERRIDKVFIGAMSTESALSYLRRYANKAIITGGDRVDMQLAALETSTSCLILTGGIYPSPQVIAKAEKLNIPVMLVSEDTFSASKRFENITAKIEAKDRKKIETIKKMVKENVDLSKLEGE